MIRSFALNLNPNHNLNLLLFLRRKLASLFREPTRNSMRGQIKIKSNCLPLCGGDLQFDWACECVDQMIEWINTP